jgi:hypothetical protein
MKDWWTHAKSWLLIAAAVGFSILILVLRSLMMKKGTTQDPGFGGLPPAPAALQTAADDAYEASITVKANAKATSEASKVQLVEISKMDDRKARRAALANFVKNS